MVVAICDPINSYVGNNSANTFSFTFPIFSQNQLLVTVAPIAGGTAFTLTPGADYLVTGLNPTGDPASTGNIELINAGQAWLTGNNLATGWVLTLVRALPIAQNTTIRNQGDFYRSTLENALDYIVMLLQDQAAETLILTDQVTGIEYQLVMINGVLSQIPLT